MWETNQALYAHNLTVSFSVRWSTALFSMTDLAMIAVHKMSTVIQRWQVAAVALTWDMVRNRVNARAQLRSIFRAQGKVMRQWCLYLSGRGFSPTPCSSPSGAIDGENLPPIEDEPDKV